MSEYSFSGIISRCQTFQDFYFHLKHLSPNLSGRLFEEFVEYYFLFAYERPVANYYRIDRMPPHILNWLEIPKTDIGIDAMVEFEDGEWMTVQVKFRSNTRKATDYRELSTWLATTFSLAPKGITRGILATNVDIISEKMRHSTNIVRVLGAQFNKLPREFFDRIRKVQEERAKQLSAPEAPPQPQITYFEPAQIQRHTEFHKFSREQLFTILDSFRHNSKL